MSTPRLPWDDVVSAEVRTPSDTPVLPQPIVPAAKVHIAVPPGAVRTAVHGAAAVRLAAVRRHVLAHCASGVRVLAPTHEQAHDVVRHVLDGTAASFGVERAGWVGFSVRLATPALMARGLTPVSSLGFEAIVARVVSRAREEGALAFFGETARHPGFVPSLARTMSDVRLAGVPAAALDNGTPKGRDLAWLLSAVEQAMVELRHADRAEVLALAAAAVHADSAPDLALPLVLVDPPLASRRDVALAHALIRRSASPLLTAPAGDPWLQRLTADLGPCAAVAVCLNGLLMSAAESVMSGYF